jgi:hypothetical protein
MASGFYTWAKVAATNGNVDTTINMAEGMAPSAVNDSCRAIMARLAEYRDDTSGSITTGGTSTAFTLTTNQVFASLTVMDKQTITVVFHTTSGAAPTLAVDGLTAKSLRKYTGVAPSTGAFITGTPYQFTYYNTAGEFLLNSAALSANADLATAAAWTLKGNNTSGVATPTDFTIDALTAKVIPLAADEVPIWDAAGAAMKKATLSSLTNAFAPRGLIAGVTLSGGGSQTLTIASGVATSDDFTTLMSLVSNYTKTFSNWVVGSGNGGLDAGSIASNTWYHVYIIERLDTVVADVLISTSATAPTMPTNYTVKRRIGSIRTDATPNILAFTQFGDEFIWNAERSDVSISGTFSTTPANQTLSVPLGVQTWANIQVFVAQAGSNTCGGRFFPISSSDQATDSSSNAFGSVGVTAVGATAARVVESVRGILTNTSSQIRAVSDTGTASLNIVTTGWTDYRGRFT